MANKVFQLLGEIVIEYNSGNIYKAKTDAEELKKSLSGVETEADEAGTAMQNAGETGSAALGQDSKVGGATIWLGNALWQLTLKAVNLGKQLVSAGMEYNAALEGYETNFTTLLNGDAERAQQLVQELEALAMESPLDITDTAKAAQDLLIYGTSVDEVIDTLKMMGDITLGNTERMSRLALAYNQMHGKGHLMAQEQNQMTEAGVPIVDIVTEHLNISRETYEKWREEGLISAQEVSDALFAATQEGGDFYGGMARTMENYQGKTQRAAEAGNKAVGKLFEPFFEVYKSDVLPQLITSLDNLYTWASENQDTLQGFADSLGRIANFILEPDWDETIKTTIEGWETKAKPTLEKMISLVIKADFEFPSLGSVLDKMTGSWADDIPNLPDWAKNTITFGDKSLAELLDEWEDAQEYKERTGSGGDSSATFGIPTVKGEEQEDGTTVYTVPESGSYFGIPSTKGEKQEDGSTVFRFNQSNNVNGWGPQSGMYGAYGFYGAESSLGDTLNQFNAGTNGKLTQIIGLLSNILIAVSRPMSIDVRTLSSHINTQLGRVYTQRTVL